MLSKNKLPQMREMISQFGKTAEATMNVIAGGIENLKDVGALVPQIGALGKRSFCCWWKRRLYKIPRWRF